MHVKSYNKTFQNACATQLNKSAGPVIYFVIVVFLKSRLVSSHELSLLSHPYIVYIKAGWYLQDKGAPLYV